MQDLVSIISPCYNGERYLVPFLDSVFAQTYSLIELILVDDASVDHTQDIVKSYIPLFQSRGYTLTYLRQEENKGQAAAINTGLKFVSGEYLSWMDSDDILFPEAIEKKICFLKKNMELDFVLCSGEVVSEKDLEKPLGYLKRIKPKGKDDLFKDLLDENNVVFGPGSILTRTASLKKAIPELTIFESREGQNWQLMLPLAYSCRFGYLDDVLFKYVIHEDSHSHKKRSYEEINTRRDNFYILLSHTIHHIVGMSAADKTRWDMYAYTRQVYAKYMNAIDHHKFCDYKKYRRELVNLQYPFQWKDRYFVRYFGIPIASFLQKMKQDAVGEHIK